jgi:hypothetical protein
MTWHLDIERKQACSPDPTEHDSERTQPASPWRVHITHSYPQQAQLEAYPPHSTFVPVNVRPPGSLPYHRDYESAQHECDDELITMIVSDS